jgi:hypothetical protein
VVWANDPFYSPYSFIFGNDFPSAGTSLATPLWAGFMALVNQKAAAEGKPPVGFANPALYAIGKGAGYNSSFHDIATGNNITPASPSKYYATAGYDLCSGWGAPMGSNLMQGLLAPPSENLVITPPAGFTSSGPGGGPFTVVSQIYTLTNIGTTPLKWSLVNTSLWLTATPAGGTLNPGGAAADVTVKLNSAAGNFMIGNYTGIVSFLDLTNGAAQTREFDLFAGNGGFESGDFTFWNLSGDTNLDFALSGDDTDVGGTNALPGAADDLFVHSGLYGAYLGQFPDEGSLSQTVATKPGQDYLVSFWLTSVPYQGATTSNNFVAAWNGSAFYARTNLGAFGWTNIQIVAPATAASAALKFDFVNFPAGFGLDDISVQTAPAPELQSVNRTGKTITFNWSGVAGLSYELQSAGNLGNPHWTNIAALNASGGLVSAAATNNGASQEFYRLVLEPGP